MTTLVIGATGRIGQQYCELASQAGVPVRAMIRHSASEALFSDMGVETAPGDLEMDLDTAMDGCDQVLFTAGSGPHSGSDRTLMIDLHGAIRAIDLALEKGVSRFIMVSALRADEPLEAPDNLRPYMAAKHATDAYLRAVGLPYVILKPGRLVDEEPSGLVRTERGPEPDITVSRGNVARALLTITRNTELRNVEFGLLDGDRPIENVFGA